MKKFQTIVAILVIALFSIRAHSQIQAEFHGAGSSAQFNTFALAAANGSALCGANHWSGKNAATLNDPRSGSILPEPGNIWIVWNGAADGSTATIICYYVSVDSIVGLRAYFANATVQMTAAAGAADGNLVPYIGGTSSGTLPSAIITLVNGTKINLAATDIRPEDGKFASNRVLTAYGALMTGRGFTGVGYQGSSSTPWLGVPIVSSVSTAQANPVDFAFIPGDHDPITSATPRVYQELEIGAAPVMVFVNVSNTASGHMGDSTLAITDIGKQVLNNALLGNLGHVRDLSSNNTSGADAALHVWIREPLSGTYNTMEFNVPNSNGIAGDYAQGSGRVTGQEAGILTTNTACAGHQTSSGCPAESGNPLFHFITPAVGSANGSTRGRVIGSGEMITATNNNADSLGYSFWGFSSFATSKAGNLRYLTVDGVDPLSGGTGISTTAPSNFPQCVNAAVTPCVLNFTNIKNGSYPIWSKYRAVYDYTDSLSLATNLVTLAQTAATTTYSDFVPANSLNVFHSHFAQVVTTSGGGYPGNNGIKTGVPETGGDMGGAVLTKESELDFIADSGGNQQVNLKQ